MKKVFTHESLVLVSHVKNLLAQAGIAAVIRNERLAGALGEIPYLETWPELWVEEGPDALRAAALVAEAMAEAPPAPAWTCACCGADNEGQFGACWRCQAAAPG